MPANIDPIYVKAPDVEWGAAMTAANTAKDGTGAVTVVWTADATNGGFCQSIRGRALGTNVASVARLFVNNGGSNAVAANNSLIDEASLPATALSETAATQGVEIVVNRMFPPGYQLFITLGTAVAAGWKFTAFGGQY